jgi:uncharacterized protein
MKKILSIVLILCASWQLLAQHEIPARWGLHILDEAELLSPEAVGRIEKRLQHIEDSTKHQLTVILIESLKGISMYDYALDLFKQWELGENSAVLIIVAEDHQMHFKVGVGLEEKLSPAICNRIILNELVPTFRRSEFDAGVEAAVTSMIDAANGEYISHHGSLADEVNAMIWYFVIAVLVIIAIAGLRIAGSGGWILYVFLIPLFVIIPGLVINWNSGLVLAGIYATAFPILKFIFNKMGWTEKFTDRKKFNRAKTRKQKSPGWTPSSGWFGESVLSTPNKSIDIVKDTRDFTGHGGSFSGGGSSGSW